MEYLKKFYGQDGKPVETETEACAKSLENLDTYSVRYFVKYIDGALYNPTDTEKRRRHVINSAKFVKTNETAFLLYLRFLRTKNKTALHQAQRVARG